MRPFPALCFFLLSLMAFSAQADSLFSVAPTDKSLEYLGDIFGPVGQLAYTNNYNTLFGKILSIFSASLLTLGIFVTIFNILVAVIGTASAGEMMGKKWSSIWIPARTLGGLLLLLPTETGYCKMQVFIMWLIINSVGAANSMWNLVLQSYEEGVVINQPAPQSPQTVELAKQVFRSLLCVAYLNDQISDLEKPIGWETIAPFRSGNDLLFGFPHGSPSRPVCGGFHVRDFKTIRDSLQLPIKNPEQLTQVQYTGLLGLSKLFDDAVSEALYLPNTQWNTKINIFEQAGLYFNDVLRSLIKPSEQTAQIVAGAKADGWILAGAYYYKLISAQTNSDPAQLIPTYTLPDVSSYSGLANADRYHGLLNTLTEQYLKAFTATTDKTHGQLALSPSNLGGHGKEIWDASFGQMKNIILDFTNYLTTNATDPIVSLANVGANIMISVEAIWITLMILILAISLMAHIGDCFQGVGLAIMEFVNLLTPIVVAVLLMLWVGGFSISVYLPLIPYLLYLFAALGWLMEVIEAMIGTPLVALALIIPSEDEWGHSGQSFMLFLAIALRPVLMLMGFVAGSKLLIVAIAYLNYASRATISSTLFGLGLFTSMVILAAYIGIVLVMVHQSFSLIYVLPDKVMRWIGGHGAAMMNEASMLQKTKGISDEGAQKAQGLAKGVGAKVNETSQKAGKGKKGGGGGVN